MNIGDRIAYDVVGRVARIELGHSQAANSLAAHADAYLPEHPNSAPLTEPETRQP